MKDNLNTILIIIGLLLVAAGIVMPIITKDIASDTFRYIFSAGAALHLVGRLMTRYHGQNIRVRRLVRIETMSALFFCVAAFLMFYDTHNMRDPIAFVIGGALLQVYASIMIPKAAKND